MPGLGPEASEMVVATRDSELSIHSVLVRLGRVRPRES
jgi:hypothetical protein